MATRQLLTSGFGYQLLPTSGLVAQPEFVGGSSTGIETRFFGNQSTPPGGATINPVQHLHAVNGYVAETLSPVPGLGGGTLETLDIKSIATWTAGQTYSQWAIVFDPNGAGTKAYVKYSPGSLLSTTAPSADAVNWRLNTTPGTTAPALATGNYITRGTYDSTIIRGDQPIVKEWMREGVGANAAMFLTGRTADGATGIDASLRVEGAVNCEYLTITNNIHAGNPTIGTGQLGAGATLVVPTTASDTLAKIFVTPQSALAGSLYVHNKGAASFEVTSTNVADVGVFFDWVILNPVF